MKKETAQKMLGDKQNYITYEFGCNSLPDVIRVFGYAPRGEEAPYIDIPKEKFANVIEQAEDEVFVIGRAANADYQMCAYENNLFSRIHVILQKKEDKVLLIDCSWNKATIALKQTRFGLQQLDALKHQEIWYSHIPEEVIQAFKRGHVRTHKGSWWERFLNRFLG